MDLQFSRVTFPWTILSLVLTVLAGLLINHHVDAKWISPIAMGMMMGGLMALGRIRPRARQKRVSDDGG
jgi:hypothetical protein